MAERTRILVGTTKGLFLLTSEDDRQSWRITGPHCGGWGINHAIGAGNQLWAGGGGAFFGAGVWRSENGGTDWDLAKLADGQMDDFMRNDPETAAFFGLTEVPPPAPFSGRIDAIWSLARLGDRLLAGAKPATLFASDDGGATWDCVESLTSHPSADSWQPGAAGLTLHTIVGDPANPDRVWLGISAAGVFATEDGGATWVRRNRLSNTEGCAHHPHPAGPRDGETGHCVHNMMRGPDGSLWQQNHHGVYRSGDEGRSWEDVTHGLPSTFGFPIAVHPTKAGTAFTIPLNGDSEGRYPPDASAAVWRTRDHGASWEPCRTGLPQDHCYFTVLRQAMAMDRADAPGVYFGTNTGSVFASLDEGDSWQELARHLPTVLCVETVTG